MRVLLISNLFPPYVLGGAELAASSLATWLSGCGHAVCVLTSAPSPVQAESKQNRDGVLIERRYFPNLYSVYDTKERPAWKKVVWHLRDHYNAEAETICREVIDQFQPDIVNIHDLQGIGYNLLREVGRQHLPCVQVLHDFGFLCINMRMFKNGQTCKSRHWPCLASGWIKSNYFSAIERLSFWSPSQALLNRYMPHLPLHSEARCIRLPMLFSDPSPGRLKASTGGCKHLLFVGQLLPTKGIEFILRVLLSLEKTSSFTFTIVGGGELLEPLQKEYKDKEWVNFTGRVSPEEVANFMADSDLLLMPSVWFENSPLVAYQAIQLGLPILASEIGGLPELISDHRNGRLLPAGDASAWQTALRELFESPNEVRRLREGAQEMREAFNPDLLGKEVLALFERTIRGAYSAEALPVGEDVCR